MQITGSTHVSLPPLPQVEGEVVQDVLGELVLELWVQPEHVDQPGNVETFQVAVSEGTNVARRLDDDLGNDAVGHWNALLAGAQVLGDVAAD